MRSWGWALLGGLTGATLVVGYLAWKKRRELQLRGASLRQALTAEGDRQTAYLLSKGQGIEPELRSAAMSAAQRSAQYHLATRYGLTPDLVSRLQAADRQIRRLPGVS